MRLIQVISHLNDKSECIGYKTMVVINIDTLVPGQITEGDYYSVQGELLISRGVCLTTRLINALKRRNVFELHMINSYIEAPASMSKSSRSLTKTAEDTNLRSSTFFDDIKDGEIGLQQLLHIHSVNDLDKAFRFGRVNDRPVGAALKLRMKQLYLSNRTELYKHEVKTSYSTALNEVKYILNGLADAKKIDTLKIRQVVENFMDTFVKDRNVLLAISNAKTDRGNHLYHHALNVCLLSLSIAANSGFGEEQVIHIGIGSLLHDVGMLLIPGQICQKRGRLTELEWIEVQKHPLLGVRILDKLLNLPDTVKFIAYQMHERINGKGYPKQNAGDTIHNYAKIAQVADVFEAVSSPRSYRDAFEPYIGMEMLVKMTHSGLLNEEYVRAFLSATSLFPVGTLVELNDKRIAKVIAANPRRYDKPVLSVLVNTEGKMLNAQLIYQVDLTKEPSVKIIHSLPMGTLACDILAGF
ncbi:MAG TPA: HD-GYP domain-containing protein [Chitinispirillaceae bacterium]|nr:HD-GYP domain-containing protein [Chitinispirillaceae bacterium]